MIWLLLLARHHLEGNSSILSLCLPGSKSELAEELKKRYGGSVTKYPYKAGLRYRLSGKKSWMKVRKDAKLAYARYGLESFKVLVYLAEQAFPRPVKTLRTLRNHMRRDALISCRRRSEVRPEPKMGPDGHLVYSIDMIR